MAVIDQLEEIDVDPKNETARTLSQRNGQLRVQPLFECPAVKKPCQTIMICRLAQFSQQIVANGHCATDGQRHHDQKGDGYTDRDDHIRDRHVLTHVYHAKTKHHQKCSTDEHGRQSCHRKRIDKSAKQQAWQRENYAAWSIKYCRRSTRNDEENCRAELTDAVDRIALRYASCDVLPPYGQHGGKHDQIVDKFARRPGHECLAH